MQIKKPNIKSKTLNIWLYMDRLTNVCVKLRAKAVTDGISDYLSPVILTMTRELLGSLEMMVT